MWTHLICELSNYIIPSQWSSKLWSAHFIVYAMFWSLIACNGYIDQHIIFTTSLSSVTCCASIMTIVNHTCFALTKLLIETFHSAMPMVIWVSIDLYCHTRDHVIDCCISIRTASQSSWVWFVMKIARIYSAALSTPAYAKIVSYNILTYFIPSTDQAQSLAWNLIHWMMHALRSYGLSRMIDELSVISIMTILILVWILLVCCDSKTSNSLWKFLLGSSTLIHLITLWGIVEVLGHIHNEYDDKILAANFSQAIVYFTICISITALFSSSSLLLDVMTLQSLQFLLALYGDVHPNPGPCKKNKSKANNPNREANNSSTSTNGEPTKVLGTSINLINWNARGLGRVKEQKLQDLLGLMNENNVQIAIVSKTRETAGNQNQTQTQANGYTIYKNAYHDKFHTSKYLSPEKLVWGVCLIVKNGLAFLISEIQDLTLGARLVRGTLTIPTKGNAQPMKVDILGVYGPATKDFAVNLPYWEALSKYVGNLHKLQHTEFTQGLVT
jgi:hypothetical protein